MEKVLNLYKPIGATPLQVLEKFREQNPEYKDAKMSYAGRLDPLAEGVLILLVDEENKKREKYQKLDKEYEFEVLFGVATDTYDLLGIVDDKARIPQTFPSGFSEKKIKNFAASLIGKQQQPYPPFSSFQIDKKPLFQWAKEGRLDEIEIPTKEIEIYDIKHLGTYTIEAENLHKLIIERVNKVRGKFRQQEILKRWEMFFEENRRCHSGANPKDKAIESQKLYSPAEEKSQTLGTSSESDSGESAGFQSDKSLLIFPIMKFCIHCGSGTYVRQIAHEMGRVVNTGALALSIKRTKVGEYKLEKSLRL